MTNKRLLHKNENYNKQSFIFSAFACHCTSHPAILAIPCVTSSTRAAPFQWAGLFPQVH